MEMSASMRDRLIAANQREYGERYEQLPFPAPSQAQRALARRAELLEALHGRVAVGYGGTKLDCSGLSPGCRICAAGGWSCLFITGRCNCSCFYCPAAQTDNDLPTTNAVDFRTPADYLGYLERFGFRGASISGGEPLLSPKRSLAYVRAVKNTSAPPCMCGSIPTAPWPTTPCYVSWPMPASMKSASISAPPTIASTSCDWPPG